MAASGARPRLWSDCSSHPSYRRVGEALRAMVAPRTQSARHPGEADLALLVHHPAELVRISHQLPSLAACHVIAMVAWESLDLSGDVRAALDLVDEVWAPSAWSWQVLAQAHPAVFWVPHPVPPPPPPSAGLVGEERELLAELTAWAGSRLVILAVGAAEDQRKNIPGLRRAFAAVAGELPEACLVIKSPADRGHQGRRTLSRWQVLGAQQARLAAHLSDAGMEHLYAASAVLASAHHAEAWGLALSDAMARGLPVVATLASGNTDFMTRHNSLAVAASVARVREVDRYFRPPWRWYAPHPESLAAQLVAAVRGRGSEERRRMVARARADVAAYAPERVAARACERVDAIWAARRGPAPPALPAAGALRGE